MKTLSDRYGPAMTITDQAAADTYFKKLVEESGFSGPKAEEMERDNLGYFAGYYDNNTRERVERLFKCAHPIFGKISESGAPTPSEALAAGMITAKRGVKEAAKAFKAGLLPKV